VFRANGAAKQDPAPAELSTYIRLSGNKPFVLLQRSLCDSTSQVGDFTQKTNIGLSWSGERFLLLLM
jgi:hypothetical protein